MFYQYGDVRSGLPFTANSEDCHASALNNMFQLYGLGRESMKVTTSDVQVSAKQPIPLPTGSLRSDSKGKESEGQDFNTVSLG